MQTIERKNRAFAFVSLDGTHVDRSAPISTNCNEYQLALPWQNPPRNWSLKGRSALLEFIGVELAKQPIEHLLALYLDEDLNLLAINSVGRSSISSVDFRLSEILRAGVSLGAAAFILLHNHPSGKAEPSNADLIATKRIRDISDALDMPLIDHLIVTRTAVTPIGSW